MIRQLLFKFDRKWLTLFITLFSILLALILQELIYKSIGKEVQPFNYFAAIVIPLIIAPLANWYLFGLLIDFYKSENAREILLKELHETKERLQASQKIAKLGSWHFDIQTDQLLWSEEIYRIFEIDPERFGVSYEAFLNAIHPEDRDSVN